MAVQYELKPWIIDPAHSFYELVSVSAFETNLEKLMKSKRREDFSNLVRQIAKIMDYGVQKACSTKKLRCLDASAGLYEIKGYSDPYRYMSYVMIGQPPLIVPMFEFVGHKGEGNIHNQINHGLNIIKGAHECLEELVMRKE